jgi:hypothetical protein
MAVVLYLKYEVQCTKTSRCYCTVRYSKRREYQGIEYFFVYCNLPYKSYIVLPSERLNKVNYLNLVR